MHLPRTVLVAVAALLAAGACASVPPGPATGSPTPDSPAAPATRGDPRTITTSDLVNATQASLFDFVVAERPQWLRGPDGRPAAVTVYLNEAPAGSTSALRDITLTRVASARFLDLAAAQQRYTARLNGPVIAVTTR